MKGFFEKLVKACPLLPFLALGVWLAWAYIAYSGTAWLSDTEMNGANISTMYIVSTDRKSTRLNSSHIQKSRMPSSA